ncbi:MAG TPA: phospholipase D-like domain-containing protein [Stellaceae bacterium]|nr:phospholipase D-like domain-containing protein [Stellaceae bacterium]
MSSLTFPWLFALHLLAAGGVTVHALLRNRDVRAATAWIGLAWLSPFLGAGLYWLLGINRVARRAGEFERARRGSRTGSPALLPVPEGLAGIEAVGRRLSGRALTGGNRIVPLESGDAAYPEMLAAIEGAHASVALASYIFEPDEAGGRFVEALAAARDRGVEVRVLIDGIGGGYVRAPGHRALKARGVRSALFLHNWAPWRMPLLNLRNHKKLLIVDGAVGFTGGLNIARANVRALGGTIVDVHFRLDGPVVAHLMAAFAEDWGFTTGEALEGPAWFPAIAPAGTAPARGLSGGPDQETDTLEAVIGAALSAANERVRIVTPYFLPDRWLVEALELAALRGVAVEILIPERSNRIVVDWAARAVLEDLVRRGVALHVGPGSPFDHAKLMTADGAWALIGSANWDVRSLRLNFEFDVEAYDADVTGAIDRLIDERIARARAVPAAEITDRGVAVRLRDAAARLMLPYL